MADNPIKGKLPFKIVSSSVNTGYQAELSSSFKANTAIFGLHSDEYGGLENEPLQGPFTKTHVGGNQHRHIELNDGNDNQSNRPEAFSISASNGQLKIYGPDFSNKNNPRAQMFRGAKSPVNIRNVQSTTSSLNLGNFKTNYEVVQAVGRRNFNNLINDNFVASGSLTTQFISGTQEYSLPEIKNNSKSIFVERFNAPGGKQESSRGALDREGEEYSANNSLTTRNIKVRQELYSQLTKHTPQFGSSSLEGITEHKIHRNTQRKMQYSGSDIVTGSDYDNFWVQHAIPASDMQYSWITASAENSILGYEKLSISGSSEDINFGIISYAGEIQQDINGINLLNKENFNIELSTNNLLNRDSQYPNFSYFNGLYQHPSWKQIRTGEHPVARKLKADNIFSIPDPVQQKNTSMGVVVAKNSDSSTPLKETPVTTKFKPIKQEVIVSGSSENETNKLTYTFANERSGFANKEIDTKLGANFNDSGLFDKIVSFFGAEKEYGPFQENVSLEYSETVYPSEKNTFLAETRERTEYILDQAGTGSDGYDKVFGTQRVYWRENQQDRQRTPFEALNSQGYKNVVTKFTEQSASNYYSQLLYNAELLKNTSSIIYGNSISFISSGSETYGIIGSAGEASGFSNFTGSFYLVNTTNGEWQKQIRLSFSDITASNISNVTNVRFGHKVLLKYIDNKYILAISDPYANGRHNANSPNAGIILVTSSVNFPNSAFSIGSDRCVFSSITQNDYFGYSFDIQKINNTIYLFGTALDGTTDKLFYTDIGADGAANDSSLKSVTISPSPQANSKFGTDISVISSSNKVLMFVSAPAKTTSSIYFISGTESTTPGILEQFVTKEIANTDSNTQGYGNSISSLSSSSGIYVLIGSPLENSGSGKAYLVTSSDNATTFSDPLQFTYPSKINEYFGSHVHVFSNSSGINFAISAPQYNNCGAVFLYKSNNEIINTSNYEIFGESNFIGDNFGKSFDFIKRNSAIEAYVAGDYGNSKRGSVTQVTSSTKNVANSISDFGLSVYSIDKLNGVNRYEIYDTFNKDNTYSKVKNFTLQDGGEFNKEILTKIELNYFAPASNLINIFGHKSSSINSFSVIYDNNNAKYIAAYSNYTGSSNAGSVTLLSKSNSDISWGEILTYIGKPNENFGTSLKLMSSSYGIHCFIGADHNSSIDQSGSLYCVSSSNLINWTTASLITTGTISSSFGNSLDAVYDQGKMIISVGAYKEPQYYEYRQQISNINGSGDKDYLSSSLNLTSSSPSTVGYFANSLAITGNNLLVSEHFYQYANNVTASGIVLVHSIENDNKIIYKTNITSSNKSTNYYEFGKVVKVSPYNNLVAITAQGATVGGINGAGKIHLYKLNGSAESSANWQQIQELTSSTKKTDARFGVGLKFYESGTNKYLFAGSYNYDNTSAGTRGKFEAFYSGTNGFSAIPIETAIEVVGIPVTVNMSEYGGYLGHTIEVMENLLLVSQHSSNTIRVFKIEDITTSYVTLIDKATISPPNISDATNSGFGLSMAVSGNYLFVGAPTNKGNINPPYYFFGSGSVYKYRWNGNSNSPVFTHEYSNYQQDRVSLTPPYPVGNYLFGDSLVVSGNSLYVGAPRYAHDNSSTKGIGVVYRYDLSHYKAQQGAAYVITSSNGINWSNKQQIASGNASYESYGNYGYDLLGSSISSISCSSGYQIFIASPYEDNSQNGIGNLYVVTSSDGINWSTKKSIASGSYTNNLSTAVGFGGLKSVNYKNKTYVFFAEPEYDVTSNPFSNEGSVYVISSDENNQWNQENVQKIKIINGIDIQEYLPTNNQYSNLISTVVYESGSGANYVNRLYYAVSSPSASNFGIRTGKVFVGYTDDGIEWKKYTETNKEMEFYTGSQQDEKFGTILQLLLNINEVKLFTANNTYLMSSSLTAYQFKNSYEEFNINKNLFSVSNLKIMPANLNNLAIPSVKYINNIDGFKYTTTGGEKSSIDYGLMRTISGNNTPFYDSYGEFIETARGASKEYSILPEFKISEHMDYYLNDAGSNFISNNLGFLTIDGAKYSSSLETDSFKVQYMVGDSLVEKEKIDTAYNKDLSVNEINLKITGIKKLLPYNGFYPIQRTIQLANLFSSSYSNSIVGGYKYSNTEYSGTSAAEKAKWYAALQPFFAPGILYNTIKSGIAVDFPVFTGSIPQSIGSTNEVISFGLSGTYGAEKLDVKSIISGSPNYRFPFESIIDPTIAINDTSNIPVYYTMNYNSSSYNIYPYFKLTPNYKKNYSLAMSNFLAETVNFFLTGQLSTIYSSPQVNWQELDAGKTYYMDVSLRKGDNLVMIEAYHSNIHETGLYGQKMNGRYFGFPMSLSTSNAGDPNLNHGYCDPAYAAYTPPYFEGESIATIEYTSVSGGKPTLEQIINSAKITYKNTGLLNYLGSNAANSKMTLDASVNLLGKFNGKVKDTDGTFTNQPESTENRMVIHTKFETPVLNFKNQEFINGSDIVDAVDKKDDLKHGGFGRGMWSGYGEIPATNENLVLSIRETYPEEVYTQNSKTGSLISALGFRQQSRNIGTIANNKTIYEAIIAIPYLTQYDSAKTIDIEPFNKFAIYPIRLTKEAINAVSGTARALQDAMTNYVFPPQLDFANLEDSSKYAAYVFEIKQTLDQKDLADIWQGLSPKSTKIVQTIGKQNENSQNDIFEINHANKEDEVLGIYARDKLPDNMKWMMFKVKRRGEYNYYKITDSISDDAGLSRLLSDPKTEDDRRYSYNWPHDFFSLVESAKLDVTLKYKKKN